MGKKRCRKAYTSKGSRHSVSRATVKLVRSGRSELEKAQAKIEAWRAGKNPWITIKNPLTQETNKPFVRVRANAYYGDPRRKANIYKMKDEE